MGFIKENFLKGVDQVKDFFSSVILYLEELKKKSNEIFILIILWSILFYFPRKWIQYGTLPAIIEIIFYYFTLSLIIDFFKSFFVFLYKKKHGFTFDYYDNFILGIERVSFLMLNFIFFFFFLYLINVNIKDFMTSISIFAAALVLMFKDYISNMINGMIIMFSPDFNVKDYIKIGEYKGRIININFLHTEIKTDEGDIIYIPNNNLFTDKVINYSKSNIKKIRYDFKLGILYAGKIEELTAHIVSGLCKEFEGLITEENISIKVNTIDKDIISLTLDVSSQKYNFKFEDKVKAIFSSLLLEFISFDSKNIKEIEMGDGRREMGAVTTQASFGSQLSPTDKKENTEKYLEVKEP